MSRPYARAVFVWVVMPLALSALLVWQADQFQAVSSATYDEPLHLSQVHALYRTGSFDTFIRPMNPPVPIALMGLPVVALMDGPADGDSPTWRWQMRLLRIGNTLLVGVPLVILLYIWMTLRVGPVLGGGIGLFAALSPNLLAHTSVATFDASFALFGMVGVVAMCRHAERPTRPRWAVMATAIGVAVACKQSAFFLIPVAALTPAFECWRNHRSGGRAGRVLRTAGVWAGHAAALGVWAITVNWALYGFAVAPLLQPGLEHPTFNRILGTSPEAARLKHWLEAVPIPASVNTFLGQVAHGIRGHETYTLGRYSLAAPKYYFPLAVACKCTPAELALLLFLGGWLAARWRWWWIDPTRRTWVLAAALLTAVCVNSKLALGLRYMALCYPLFLMLAADACGDVFHSVRRKVLAVGLLVVGQLVASVGIHPHYLCYFNSLVGGPAEGDKYFGDSNLDWGQGLPGIPDEIARLGGGTVCLAYFGTADPRAYGIEATDWRTGEAAVFSCDWIVVSVSLIQGFEYGPEPFAKFGPLRPSGRVNYALWVYPMRDPAVRDALTHARNSYRPPLKSEH